MDDATSFTVGSSPIRRIGARNSERRSRRRQRDSQPSVVESGDPQASGKEYRITSTLKEGISSEDAKKIGKLIRDEGPKSVKSQIQGDELRVSSKKRDDLQAVMALIRKEIADSPRFVVVLGWGCYDVPQETAERIEWGLVDWAWFPEREPASGKTPWRPPPEMREAMKRAKQK